MNFKHFVVHDFGTADRENCSNRVLRSLARGGHYEQYQLYVRSGVAGPVSWTTTMRRIAEVRAAGNRDKRFTGSQSTTFHSTDRHSFVEIERLRDLSERACLSKLREVVTVPFYALGASDMTCKRRLLGFNQSRR